MGVCVEVLHRAEVRLEELQRLSRLFSEATDTAEEQHVKRLHGHEQPGCAPSDAMMVRNIRSIVALAEREAQMESQHYQEQHHWRQYDRRAPAMAAAAAPAYPYVPEDDVDGFIHDADGPPAATAVAASAEVLV
jgi:hypothetical protein